MKSLIDRWLYWVPPCLVGIVLVVAIAVSWLLSDSRRSVVDSPAVQHTETADVYLVSEFDGVKVYYLRYRGPFGVVKDATIAVKGDQVSVGVGR